MRYSESAVRIRLGLGLGLGSGLGLGLGLDSVRGSTISHKMKYLPRLWKTPMKSYGLTVRIWNVGGRYEALCLVLFYTYRGSIRETTGGRGWAHTRRHSRGLTKCL